MTRLLLAVALLLLAVPAFAEDPPPAKKPPIPTGVVRDQAPFNNNPTQMGLSLCETAVTNCTVIDQAVALAESNTCSRRLFNLQSDMLTEFQPFGELENCSIPSDAHPSEIAGGKAVFKWPVCCYQADEATSTCKLFCGLFMAE